MVPAGTKAIMAAMTPDEVEAALHSDSAARRDQAERLLARYGRPSTAFAGAARDYKAVQAMRREGDAGFFLRTFGHADEAALREDVAKVGPLQATVQGTAIRELVEEAATVEVTEDTTWDGERGVYVHFAAIAEAAWLTAEHAAGGAAEAGLPGLARGETDKAMDERARLIEQRLSPAEVFLFFRQVARGRGAFGLDPRLPRKAENARDRVRGRRRTTAS